MRLGAAVAALLPAACAGLPSRSPPPNPFFGAWTTEDRDRIEFRQDTVVLLPAGEPPIPIGATECAGAFRFRYGRMTRASLTGLAPSQPDVQAKLSGILVQPIYPVAELGCDHGVSTYVLLDHADLVAIYRDEDIVGFDRLTRL